MDFWPPHQYQESAAEAGLSPEVAEAALQQARQVQARGFPPILTLGHLCEHTGTPYTYLRRIVERQHDPYRVFSIRKRSGGRRNICVPEAPLRRVQRALSRSVLALGEVHPTSCAYSPGSSPLRCAEQHVGCKWLIKADIQQFFESISEIQVYRVFRQLGYQPLIAFELARLTTRVLPPGKRYDRAQWRRSGGREYVIESYVYPFIGHLPQGAPTSPMLSNLAMVRLDAECQTLAESHGMVYTRYSDDLIFSTADCSFCRRRAHEVIGQVYAIMRRTGLRPRTTKTSVSPPSSRKVVLGLLVDGKSPRLTREFRRKMECHVHYIKRFGPAAHASRRSFSSVLDLRRYIEGLCSYAASVDAALGDWLQQELGSVHWPL